MDLHGELGTERITARRSVERCAEKKIFKYIEFYCPDIKLQCLDMDFQCFVHQYSLSWTLNKENLKNHVLRSNKRCADSDGHCPEVNFYCLRASPNANRVHFIYLLTFLFH